MTIKWEAGTYTTIASTELNSLANGGGALGTEYDNSSNQYMYAEFQLAVTYGSNATAGTTVDIYLIPAYDGSNYADSQNMSSVLTGSFPMRATTAHVVPLRGPTGALISIPPCKFKIRVVNNSGQAFPASGSTLKMLPYRMQ